jgi:pilus assembly protein CpaB
MNQRVSIILIAALVVSAVATYGVYRMMASRINDTKTATVQVIQAAKTLEVGAIIKDGDIKVGPWAGAVTPGLAVKKEAVIGRGVTSTIYEGEPILDSRLAAIGAGGGLASTIPTGMRAVAVRVNDVVGVAGFVGPGAYVDVVITGNAPGGTATNGQQAKTLLQNIQVLSAGQNYKTDAEGKPAVVPVVNLLVTPEQAEMLSLVNNGNEAKIQLVLRNPVDKDQAKTPGTAVANLFGAPVKPPATGGTGAMRAAVRKVAIVPEKVLLPPPPPPPPPILVEVFNGAKQSEAKFARVPEVKQ